jgi:methylenetetrahydrofolate reductase (NADPH)
MTLIRDILNAKRPTFSFEIFPPKPESPLETVYETVAALRILRPDFISVTYGAAGSSRNKTVDIASLVRNRWGQVALAHLTCIGSTRSEVMEVLEELDQENVSNVLALRGDPRDAEERSDFRHALDLIRQIRAGQFGDFCVGAAAYPEGHVECDSLDEDIRHLRMKVDAGVDFLVTQLFFDNEIFYRFMDLAGRAGIDVPVVAGIMPVLNARQIGRVVSLCGASIPPKFARIMRRYEHAPDALREAGIAYATEQIVDLVSWGAAGIHLYTMNRPDIAERIMKNIGAVRASVVTRE